MTARKVRSAHVAALLALTLPILGSTTTPGQPPARDAVQLAAICVKTGEKVSGQFKTCFYKCAGAGEAMIVLATATCPATVAH
jgi:hypothetical protein